MLVENDPAAFKRLVESLPEKFRLPIEIRNQLAKRGAAASNPFEGRRTPRFFCNGLAVVTPHRLNQALAVQREQATAVVRDLSRTGIGLICHEQHYPLEQFIVELDHAIIRATIKRVRRIAEFCYETGVTINEYHSKQEAS
jgi:hypothetical protein